MAVIVTQQRAFVGIDIVFFSKKKFLKMPNTPEYAQVLVETWEKLNFVTAQLQIGVILYRFIQNLQISSVV